MRPREEKIDQFQYEQKDFRYVLNFQKSGKNYKEISANKDYNYSFYMNNTRYYRDQLSNTHDFERKVPMQRINDKIIEDFIQAERSFVKALQKDGYSIKQEFFFQIQEEKSYFILKDFFQDNNLVDLERIH